MSVDKQEADRLSGWKEIGQYLRRSVRSVQRWEHELNLPVRRIKTAHGQAVFASRTELDAWMARFEKLPADRPDEREPVGRGAVEGEPPVPVASKPQLPTAGHPGRYNGVRRFTRMVEAVWSALTSRRQPAAETGVKAPRRIESLAVLPLANRCAEPGQDFFVDGMTDALIAELSRLQALRVISLTSVMRYRDTVKPATEVAAELGVDALVEGSVMVVDGRVRVQARLVDAATDQHVWACEYDRPAADVLALHSDMARAIAADIRVRLSAAERAHLIAERQVNPVAHDLWLKGRYLQLKTVWTRADYEQALRFFEQSATQDPDFAPAYVGQADICHRLGGYGFWTPKETFSRAKMAAERAVALDGTLASAHAAVAFSRWLHDWDYAGAEREFLKAVALGSHEAIHQYASLLSLMGRHDEAVARCLHALAVNPFSSNVHWSLGMVYRLGGWPDRGVEALRAWLLVEPNDMQSTFQLALTLVERARYDEAIAILERLAAIPSLKGLALGALAHARGRSGRRDEAQVVLSELLSLAAAGYPVHGWLAIGHMGLGDHERALDALTDAIEMHDSWMPTYMSVEPAFAPLRRHPRFQTLLKRAGHAAA